MRPTSRIQAGRPYLRIQRVRELKPEIVLLDINMPVMGGMQAAYEIRQVAPSTKIVFFTIHDSPQLVSELRPYSHAFVSKSAAGTDLIPTLNRLMQEETPHRSVASAADSITAD